MKLTEIAFEGVETFEELVRIPLRRLTFLYGPNSAGKSVISDVLDLIGATLREVPAIGRVRGDKLMMLWRRTGSRPADVAPQVRVGFTAVLDVRLRGSLEGVERYPSAPNEAPYVVEIDFVFRGYPPANPEWPHPELIFCDFEIKVDGESLLNFVDRERVSLKYDHPVIRGLFPLADIEVAALKSPTVFVIADGWVRASGCATFNSHYDLDEAALLTFGGGVEPRPKGEDAINAATARAMSTFSSAFNVVRSIVFGNCSVMCRLAKASRKVPDTDDMAFIVSGDAYGDPLEEFRISTKGDPEYEDLALSFAHRVWAGMGVSPRPSRLLRTTMFDDVNRILAEDLFSERGYALQGDFRHMLSEQHIAALQEEGQIDWSDTALAVRFYLVDSAGRRFGFTEVGSGLGYVLPILCSICSSHDGSEETVLLQQPELHLHPALQSNLGDAFIGASRNGATRLLVETHSEHILLRVLRRIRQHSRGTVPNHELGISAEDVAVYYFDPSPNGATRVSRLRVSTDGDFIDRWPRGFFAERDAELFDE